MKKTNTVNTDSYLEHIETSLTYVGISEKSLLEIRFKKDEYEVDVEDQKQIQNAVEKLTNNGKDRYHILVIPGMFGGITPEARDKEMFKTGVFSDQRSISIIVNSLPQRILGNFYFHFKKQKPKYPFQLFSSEEMALKWIRSNN